MSVGRWSAGSLVGSLVLALLPAVAATAAAAAPKRFFGVTPQGALDADDFAAIGEAGVDTLRFELSWAAVDRRPAGRDRDWSVADEIVGGAARAGVRTLPFVFRAPDWVLALDGRDCDPGGCRVYGPRGRRALAAWRGFLGRAVRRYGPGGDFWAANPSLPKLPIRVWQIWNEQNSPTYWRPRPDVQAYARLLDAAHRAITRRDPGAEVVLGGMFGTPFGGRKPGIAASDFLADLYEREGARRDFDGVAAHPYAGRFADVRAQVARLRARMAAAGDRRASLWITELGWASGGTPNPLNRGLAGQAKLLERAFRYFLDRRRRFGIENVTWYSWRDNSSADAGLCEWCAESGLLNEDHSTKPAFDLYRELASAN